MDDQALIQFIVEQENDENDSTSDEGFQESDEDMLMHWILQDDDSDDDEDNADEEGHRLRLLINCDSWRTFGDPTFKEHFRIDRATFEALVLAICNHLLEKGRWKRISRKGLHYSLMMVLWILASPDTFRFVGVKFGVSKGVVHFHYTYIIEALREMAPKYVRWPNAYERELISARFEERYGYLSVCGCTAPLEEPQRFVDYHTDYSILLQGVCDDNLLFRDVFVGQPGSVGDKLTFKRSPLGQNILTDPNVVGDKHLLGDGGYTLTSKLLIPYRNAGNLTEREKTHNYYQSRTRSCIERAFGLLKGKWRRLKFCPNYCIEYAVDHIISCVVLHNFILLEGNPYQGDGGLLFNEVPCNQNADQLLREAKEDGILKRDYIAAHLDGQNQLPCIA